MFKQTKKVATMIVVVAVLAGLYFAVSPYIITQEKTGVKEFDLEIKGRKLTVNLPVIKLIQGDQVTFRIKADEQGEFHIHTYDVEVEVEPDRVAMLRFNATLVGRFDLEWHLQKQAGQDRGEEIVVGAIEVSPKS